MSKKTRLLFKVLANGFVVMAVAASLGYFSLSQLKKNADSIVNDTLPGLSDAGAANAYLGDSSRTLLLIVTDDPQQRATIQHEIAQLTDRTTSYLDDYNKSIYSDDDRKNFDTLTERRADYARLRDQVIAMAMAGQRDAALSNFVAVLLPAHKVLKQAGDKLFAFNMDQGATRGKRIMTLCTFTQVALAIGSVLIFMVGFFIGLFK